MPLVRVRASAVIAAPAPVVYGIIADYRRGHPSILPPRYFENLEVLAGGQGAGTRIRFTTLTFGTRRESYAQVTEPEPGRVLVETDEATGTTTHFIVEPQPEGTSRVTFDTAYRANGVRGWIETLFVPRFLAKAYAAELQLLAQRAMAGREIV